MHENVFYYYASPLKRRIKWYLGRGREAAVGGAQRRPVDFFSTQSRGVGAAKRRLGPRSGDSYILVVRSAVEPPPHSTFATVKKNDSCNSQEKLCYT